MSNTFIEADFEYTSHNGLFLTFILAGREHGVQTNMARLFVS